MGKEELLRNMESIFSGSGEAEEEEISNISSDEYEYSDQYREEFETNYVDPYDEKREDSNEDSNEEKKEDEDFDRWCDETIANYKKFAKEFTEKL